MLSAAMLAAQETKPGNSLKVGEEKAVIVRQSKSPDGKYALAWTLKDKGGTDWELLERDLTAFYNEHEAGEIWVVDLEQGRKLDTLVSATTYIRPGTHRTLAAAWGVPGDDGRRFAIGAYDWKWGTDTIYLLDVGPQETHHTAIGPKLDEAIATFLKRTSAKARAELNIAYGVAGLPEHGTKTGFADATTVLLPFSVRVSEEDKVLAEGVLTLKLTRPGGTPAVTVAKITRGPAGPEPFSDNAALAKADAELNAVYAALLKRLGAPKAKQLREEQRAWIAQRDKQAAAAPVEAGDSARILRDRTLTQLTQQRTADLRKMLDSAK